MDNPEEDLNGLQLWFLNELVARPNSLSKFIFLVCNVWCKALGETFV